MVVFFLTEAPYNLRPCLFWLLYIARISDISNVLWCLKAFAYFFVRVLTLKFEPMSICVCDDNTSDKEGFQIGAKTTKPR